MVDPKRPLVVVESPFSANSGFGSVEANTNYARAAMRDALTRGEDPIASHLLYTQPGILDDNVPDDRRRGICAGFAWGDHADVVAFYVDAGWSRGMLDALEWWRAKGKTIEVRTLYAAGRRKAPHPESVARSSV